MSMFHDEPDSMSRELHEAGAWLREVVERLAERKELGGLAWRFTYGKRVSGGGGFPSISQWGFQIYGVVHATGERLPLHCFLEESVLLENREQAHQILDLWMDRVETGGREPE